MAAPTSSSHVQSINADLLASGRYSDLTIICQEDRFRVHRVIVCLQSKPLAAFVDNPSKGSLAGEVDLDECEPAVVKKFLEFLYAGDYFDNRASVTHNNETDVPDESHNPFSWPRSAPKRMKKGKTPVRSMHPTSPPTQTQPPQSYSSGDVNSPLILNARLYIMADKYEVQALKEMAKKKYEQVVAGGWNDASFAASLKLLYDNTAESDRLLKDIAVRTAGKNLKVLVNRCEFAEMCKVNGEIAFDIIKAHLTETKTTSISWESDNIPFFA